MAAVHPAGPDPMMTTFSAMLSLLANIDHVFKEIIYEVIRRPRNWCGGLGTVEKQFPVPRLAPKGSRDASQALKRKRLEVNERSLRREPQAFFVDGWKAL